MGHARSTTSLHALAHLTCRHTCMQWTAFAVALQSLGDGGASKYQDESRALHTAMAQVCKEEGLPVLEDRHAMMQQLAAKCPKRLQAVLREALPPDVRTEAIQAEVGSLQEAVQKLQAQVLDLGQLLSGLQVDISDVKAQLPLLLAKTNDTQDAPPPCLSPFLKRWWEVDMKWLRRVATPKFLESLSQWLRDTEGSVAL